MEDHYFLDANGKRAYLTQAEIDETDTLTAQMYAMLERHRAEGLALEAERIAFRDRVLARAAAERAAKP